VDTTATIDEIGLRAPIPHAPRAEGEERVVILGDSTFFGFGIPDPLTMDRVLAEELGGVTVINAGVPGYSTEQSMRLLDESIWALEPTLLVVACFWSDTNFGPFRDKDLFRTLELSDSRVLARSALLRWLATWLSQLMPADTSRIVTWPEGEPLPEFTERRVEIQDYAANLDTIIRAAASRGAGVILLAPPARVEVEGDLVEPPHQWDVYRDTQAAVARHHGLVRVDATPIFRAAYLADEQRSIGALFIDDMHPTVLGQSMLASAVARALQDSGWPTNPQISSQTEPMDVRHFEDTTPEDRKAPGDRSPVQNLFVVEGDMTAKGASHQGGGGKLPIRIIGGQGPFQVTVTAGGRVVSRARVSEPGSIALSLPKSDGPAEVQVTDSTGQSRVMEVHGVGREAVAEF
jgi:lysophospholipase L1-like esterase